MTYLVTGAAGFIGMHVAERLLSRGEKVVGLDNLNDYYDVSLKEARLARLTPQANFTFFRADLADWETVEGVFRGKRPSIVIHLAAQAGVRYGMTNPHAYAQSNLVGFLNILEGCRHYGARHLAFASSSSVYGANTAVPFRETHNVDHPLSLYAATKKSNELMAHAYAHLYALPTTGLRFFTVYGPWGRPDMALFQFTRKILAGEPIDVFNNGHHARDFTYIDDIVEGVIRCADRAATSNPDWDGARPDPATSAAPYRIYNIGNNQPVALLDFIACIEDALGRKAIRILRPMQPGDVPTTFADIDALAGDVDFATHTPIKEGILRFVAWYRDHYSV